MDSQTEETDRLFSRGKDSGCKDESAPNFQEILKEFGSVDDILERYVGEFGQAQLWHFVLVSLAWTLEGLITMATIFADRAPEYQCVPQISSQSNGTRMCPPASKLCDLEPSLWESALGKGASTVSEWNLICGDEYKAGLAGSLFFVGALLGEGVYGNLSDSVLGRKGALVLSCLTTSIMALLTSVAPNYWVYIFLRFLTGMNAAGIGSCCFVLGTELVGCKKRESVGMFAFYFFSFGIMILPAFGYLSATSWRTLYFFISAAGFLYCALVLPFLSESPRWLLVRGRTGEALAILRDFAERNGSFLPTNVCLIAEKAEFQTEDEDKAAEVELLTMKAYDIDSGNPVLGYPVQCGEMGSASPMGIYSYEKHTKESSEIAGTIFGVFRYGEIRCRMLLMACIWFFTGVAYYGISLNVVNMDFNLYLGVFLNGFIEIPAFALPSLMLNRLGKRFMLIFALCLSGVCCLLGSLLFVDKEGTVMNSNSLAMDSLNGLANSNITSGHFSEGDQLFSTFSLSSEGKNKLLVYLRLLCGVTGLFGLGGAYSLLYIYTLELFPTMVRNAALGLASQCASVGSMVAPLVVVLGRYNPSAPFIIFGVFSLLGAAMGFRFPDHRHEALFETLEGMEAENSKKRLHTKIQDLV